MRFDPAIRPGRRFLFSSLLLVLALGGCIGFYPTQNMTEEERAELERWRTERVRLPAEALAAEPFSDETKAALQSFRDAWEEHRSEAFAVAKERRAALENGMGLDALEGRLQALEPLIVSFTTLVGQTDYEIDVLAADRFFTEFGGLPHPDTIGLQTAARLLEVKSNAQAQRGDLGGTLESAEAIVRSGQVSRYPMAISKAIGIALCGLGTRVWDNAVEQCEAPELLRRALESQNEIAARHPIGPDDLNPMRADSIGILRDLKRRGMEVKMQDLTGPELVAESMRAGNEYREQVILPLIEDDPDLTEKVRQMIKIYGGMSGWGAGRGMKASYAVAWPNFRELNARASKVRNDFDLLRAKTARKLHALEFSEQAPGGGNS